MDAIGALKQDHRSIEALFKQFERAGQRAKRTKKKLIEAIVEEFARHADVEEQVLFPVVRQSARESALVFQALEEHGLIKPLLEQLPAMEPDEERFEAKATVLIETVRHHMKNEERTLLPTLRGALTRSQLDELGQRMVDGRKALKEPEDYLQSG